MFGRKKTVSELKVHADTHHDKAGVHLTEADRHKIMASAARNEGEKADSTASKIGVVVCATGIGPGIQQ